ncbi:MAG: hypothetical protein QM692_05925 [Thermomicrobiales bacterium]
MISWQFFPKSSRLPPHLDSLVRVFEDNEGAIQSVVDGAERALTSNAVLGALAAELVLLGYRVEMSKASEDKIHVPVLFGRNGKIEKTFAADAFSLQDRTVLEIEAGRAIVNNAVLKDLFEACMMQDVDYAVIAVRNVYQRTRDFEKVVTLFDTLYASQRLKLPLAGVLVIGY